MKLMSPQWNYVPTTVTFSNQFLKYFHRQSRWSAWLLKIKLYPHNFHGLAHQVFSQVILSNFHRLVSLVLSQPIPPKFHGLASVVFSQVIPPTSLDTSLHKLLGKPNPSTWGKSSSTFISDTKLRLYIWALTSSFDFSCFATANAASPTCDKTTISITGKSTSPPSPGYQAAPGAWLSLQGVQCPDGKPKGSHTSKVMKLREACVENMVKKVQEFLKQG